MPGTKAKRSSVKKPVSNDPAPAGPADPEKNSGTEKPVAGTNRFYDKKAVSRESGAVMPEEKPEPEKPVPGEIPVIPSGTGSVSKYQSRDRTTE